MKQLPLGATFSSSALRYSAILLLAPVLAAQSKSILPSPETNSDNHQHVTVLRSTDSSEGSRVAVTSDQSLNNYEAYRRGDRFYVRIPTSDVPRADNLRGRGFEDVKTQRSGDGTLVSFRLEPGANAHVERRANNLDVVFTMPGASASDLASESERSTQVTDRPNAEAYTRKSPYESNYNVQTSSSSTTSQDLQSQPGPSPVEPLSSASAAGPTPSPKSSPVADGNTVDSSGMSAAQPSNTLWNQLKDRTHYWILLAQLNPIPVAISAGLLLFVFTLFLFQRKRSRVSRRVQSDTVARSEQWKVTKLKPNENEPNLSTERSATRTAEPSAVLAPPIPEGPVEVSMNPATNGSNAAERPTSTAVEEVRRALVNRVAEEANKLLAGDHYDEGLINSQDLETRRLVGAELLSALVGRNVPRRERARAAFMKHGFFDDATHDLRVAESVSERAAAARRLIFVHDREATPHLLGALEDPAPDVRRAAVEALIDLRDPDAIAPLNFLLQSENDRKVPRPLIKHAIEVCATSAPSRPSASTKQSVSKPIPDAIPPAETEREVIEL